MALVRISKTIFIIGYIEISEVIKMNLGAKIKKIRESKNLTQKQLAEKIGVTPVTITRYESNKREPNIETLSKIAAALGITPNDLMLETQVFALEKTLDDKFKETCKKAVKFYGVTSRKQLAQEECAELIQALSKDLRAKEHNVEEEIADVLIMIEQLIHVYDVDKIEEWQKKKIDRLDKLMRY